MTKRRTINPAALPTVGQPLAGGFFAGRIFFDGAEHAVIDAGRDLKSPPTGGRKRGRARASVAPRRASTAWPTPKPWPPRAALSLARCWA